MTTFADEGAGRFGFPAEIDEITARLVAAGVAVMGVGYLVGGGPVVLALLAYGFIARVIAGPRFSALALLVTRVVRPRLQVAARPTAGPPKRFAQAVGVVFTVAALVAHLVGAGAVAWGLIALLVVCATLEAAVGVCVGCVVFGLLMRWGVVPEETCARCASWGREQPDAG